MEKDYLDPLTTILAVVFGFLLSEGASWLRSRSALRGSADTTRILVEMEIDSNQKLLADYWRSIISSEDQWYSEDGSLAYGTLGQRIVAAPFPALSRQVLIGLVERLPSAYAAHDIQTKWTTYQLMEKLVLLHREIETQASMSKEVGAAPVFSGRPPNGMMSMMREGVHFQQHVRPLAEEFIRTIQLIMGDRYLDFPRKTT